MTDDVASYPARHALDLATEIVTSFVRYNAILPAELPALIQSTYAAIDTIAHPAPEIVEAAPEPAVAIRSSIKPDYIVCLEDGAKLKMLKRYLRTNFNMSPEDYRAKWKLPADYPMVAPNYAEQRRMLAKKIGLGRKPAPAPAPARKAAKR